MSSKFVALNQILSLDVPEHLLQQLLRLPPQELAGPWISKPVLDLAYLMGVQYIVIRLPERPEPQ